MGLLDRVTGRRALLEEIEMLRRENRRLRRDRSSQGGGMRSIAGLQEKVIQLDEALDIVYINSPLANELGTTKDALLGRPLAEIDRFPWAPQLLGKVVDQARDQDGGDGTGEAIAERRHTDESGRETFIRVKANWRQGRPQILIEDITNLRSLEQIFARYVSPTVIEKMKRSTERDFFRTERSTLTVMFADLRGFTSAAQGLAPEAVRDTINEFLAAMIEVVDRHEAYVDKVVADEVMVLFGAPIPDATHAAKAVRVALEMQAAQAQVVARWRASGRPAIHMGVGINTGEMVVGNIGSRKRVDYTVLGHNVNVAARLCSHAGPQEILITESTHAAAIAAAPDLAQVLEFVEAEPLQAKGIDDPLRVLGVRPR